MHSVDPAQCDDGVFCNGRELCDPEMGCTAGLRESCNDSDVCTIDRCDEESKSCVHVGRDQDGDGEADFFCPDIGGTDCNDNDPRVGATIREVCDDDKDNDCDERVDEADCGAPAHDTCDDALDVSAGGVFSLSTRGAVSDYRTCAPSGRRDLVLTFTLEEARSVVLRAEGASLTYLSLQTECGDRGSELRCASGFPGEVRSRSLDAGTYFVIVSDIGGDLVVEVDFDEPEPPAPNDVCDGALDVSAGGSFAGSLVEVANDATATCGFGGPELFYTFTLDGPRDVILSATASTGDSMAIGVSQTCFGEELRCARGAPAGTRLHELGAGTYFVAVEGSASREADFTLTVAFEDPTPPPTGDTCAAPLPLTADLRRRPRPSPTSRTTTRFRARSSFATPCTASCSTSEATSPSRPTPTVPSSTSRCARPATTSTARCVASRATRAARVCATCPPVSTTSSSSRSPARATTSR
ncbi:MAG: hypothetical protein R3B99_22125 [Polyangiales bacterium]